MKKIVIEKHKNGINIFFFPSSKREDFEIDEIRTLLHKLGMQFDYGCLQDEENRTIYSEWNWDWSLFSDDFPIFIYSSDENEDELTEDDEIDTLFGKVRMGDFEKLLEEKAKKESIEWEKKSVLGKWIDYLRYGLSIYRMQISLLIEKIKLVIDEGKYDENDELENNNGGR